MVRVKRLELKIFLIFFTNEKFLVTLPSENRIQKRGKVEKSIVKKCKI